MNTALLETAGRLLEMASDSYSNHGCNDFYLPDTPENRELLRAAQLEAYGEEVDIHVDEKGRLVSHDYLLMRFCAKVFSGKLNFSTLAPRKVTGHLIRNERGAYLSRHFVWHHTDVQKAFVHSSNLLKVLEGSFVNWRSKPKDFIPAVYDEQTGKITIMGEPTVVS